MRACLTPSALLFSCALCSSLFSRLRVPGRLHERNGRPLPCGSVLSDGGRRVQPLPARPVRSDAGHDRPALHGILRSGEQTTQFAGSSSALAASFGSSPQSRHRLIRWFAQGFYGANPSKTTSSCDGACSAGAANPFALLPCDFVFSRAVRFRLCLAVLQASCARPMRTISTPPLSSAESVGPSLLLSRCHAVLAPSGSVLPLNFALLISDSCID